MYYLGRLRFRPGVDPPELEDLLEAIDQAGAARRREMLRKALIGGMGQGGAQTLGGVEDEEVADLMDGLLGEF